MAVLRRAGANRHRRWNTSESSAERSLIPQDASVRIFDGYADVKAGYDGPRLSRQDGVFAIGSCFAREVEHYLAEHGARVLSLTHEAILDPAFHDADGRERSTYFHRYTPQAIRQDMARAFDAVEGWDEEASLLFPVGRNVYDFDLAWTESSDLSPAATLARRRAAAGRARGLKDAACVVVTLGLIEAWRHRPSGLWCNQIHPRVLKGRPGEFELQLTTYEETLACLEDMHALLRAHGRPDVQLVVTVSPVPLQMTFTDQDIIEANAESKAVLRAAAGAFVRRHANAHYFPSYEMVAYSHPKRAWKADRVHVRAGLVAEIVARFMALYYRPVESLALAAE